MEIRWCCPLVATIKTKVLIKMKTFTTTESVLIDALLHLTHVLFDFLNSFFVRRNCCHGMLGYFKTETVSCAGGQQDG